MTNPRPCSTSWPQPRRLRLLTGASVAVLGLAVMASPAHAQLARLKSVLGSAVVSTATGTPTTVSSEGTVRSQSMLDALARQQAERAQVQSLAAMISAVRNAALAATRTVPTDGLSVNGLNPAVKAATAATADSTGKATWQGADLPTQTVSNGKYTVTVNQTASRAILSWSKFDISANTELDFAQSSSKWVVLNRVSDPSASPTTILGTIKAPGTVVVINRDGVIFGQGASVNTQSLLVSSLEIGNFGTQSGTSINNFTGLTLQQRNVAFLQNGLLGPSASAGQFTTMLTSSLAGTGTYDISNPNSAFDTTVEGAVTVDPGASITAGTSGFIILTAPTITNAGVLKAVDGQISLQAGRAISYTESTGSSAGADSDIRGLILRSTTQTAGSVTNSGYIYSQRGYLSLGADLTGSVTNSGLLQASTSVARNGVISLTAGTVTLAGAASASAASGIAILDDADGETVPQGTAASPPSFKTSRIDIGGAYVPANASLGLSALGFLGPAAVTFGQNSLLVAPSANVAVGGRAGDTFDPAVYAEVGHAALNGDITVAAGATIDVSGIKDVELAASANNVTISPLKGNELRDTPTYRSTNTTGAFTLNGQTVTVDARLSGVRSDGVAWSGSPLIEAGSAISQIADTAAQLMTKGGTVTLAVAPVQTASTVAASAKINIAKSASIDFSGGWVHYAAGLLTQTVLIAADGSLVPMSEADPNAVYIGIAGNDTATNAKFGVSATTRNLISSGQSYQAAYDEGYDAGGLIIRASTASLNGTLYGNAWAGAYQLSHASLGSTSSGLGFDTRKLQDAGEAAQLELPQGGFLRVGSFSGTSSTGVGLGADIVVNGSATPTGLTAGAITLSDSQLDAAGLSGLVLQTTGAVRFTSDSTLTLANGGALRVDAGRAIALGGTVTAHAGSITARTYEINGTVLFSSTAQIGNPFVTTDDIADHYAAATLAPAHQFDIIVGGLLDVSGRWSNDLLATAGLPSGNFATSGGSITLTVAPKVFIGLGKSLAKSDYAIDLSGSITLAKSALLDVASGGYVAPTGKLVLTAKGGSVSLLDDTVYAAITRTDPAIDTSSTTGLPITGQNQSVTFTPYVDDATGVTVRSALVPIAEKSTVTFTAANLDGFSFGGGGTFTLEAPNVSFGSATGGAHIDLDFLQQTGFGTLAVYAWASKTYTNLFGNTLPGNSAFLATTSFAVGKGQTLNLSQALLPAVPDAATASLLKTLPTGSAVTSVVSASIPVSAWDQKAANLVLGGLSELDVAAGGTITGAAGASITTPGLYNAGTIRLVGGSITQTALLPSEFSADAIGVTALDQVLGGGTKGPGGREVWNENADSLVIGLTNGKLFSATGKDRTVYFLGTLADGVGVELASGSVTDLSGGLVLNPRAPLLADGTQAQVGTLYAGGSLTLSGAYAGGQSLFSLPTYGAARVELFKDGSFNPITASVVARTIAADTGSTLNLSGASATLDQQTSQGTYYRSQQWSNAGGLTVLSGGTIAGATILAKGGAAAANGGTLEWLDPVFVQTLDQALATPGELAADQITGSGFTTVWARGKAGFDGTVKLTLGQAFLLTAADLPSTSISEKVYQTSVSLISDGAAVVSAPYIRLASGSPIAASGLTTSAATGSLTFAATTLDLVGGLSFVVPTSGSVNFQGRDAVRLTGVADPITSATVNAGLTGAVLSTGDLNFTAGQVYATTGTGNLQQLLEDQHNGTSLSADLPFILASLADNGTVSFHGVGGTAPATPLSAGTWVEVLGANIVQNGVLRAPLGLLQLGSSTSTSLPGSLLSAPATTSLSFGAGSITSVSADGASIPYGTTTDLTSYYFSPNVNASLTVAPVGKLDLAGAAISINTGAKIDGNGGGDVFAYEFVSGTGGSRDVLSRTNADEFSATNGLQYADGRQVYALVPLASAGSVAAYDPLYSAGYTAGHGDLYGLQAGMTVTLDGGNGIKAGTYLVEPAHYALLAGAYRVVENTASSAPAAGTSTLQLDGSVIMGGTFGTAYSGYQGSERYSFTVSPKSSWSQYSKDVATSGTSTFGALATAQGKAQPRSPLDAATFIIAPGTSFVANGTFEVAPATGGSGAAFDIVAAAIEIGSASATPVSGTLLLTTDTLTSLNANSLLIGAVRKDANNGTTALSVAANSITVDGDVTFSVPELVLAVGGANASLSIASGASLTASGTLASSQTGNYIVGSNANGANPGFDNTGIGALVRVASGASRSITRQLSDQGVASLSIDSGATVGGNSLLLDTSGAVNLGDTVALPANNVVLGAGSIGFTSGGISSAVATTLAAAKSLTLQSSGVITFGSTTPTSFNALTINAPGVQSDGTDLALTATKLTLGNTFADIGACATSALAGCGGTNTLALSAGEVDLTSGTFRTFGFDGGVTLAAKNGVYVVGQGTLAVDNASPAAATSLTILAPFIADHSSTQAADLANGGSTYSFLTTGAVTVDGTGLSGTATTTAQAVGSVIKFGAANASVASLAITNATIRATAGGIAAFSQGSITLAGNAALQTPGFTETIGAGTDAKVATAGGGTITLLSLGGDVALGSGTALVVDNGIGSAGQIQAYASSGVIKLGASLNAGLAATAVRTSSLTLAAGALQDGAGTAFDLAGFVTAHEAQFQGALDLYTGTGNLVLNAGQTITATSVALATDNGTLTIAGTIDTSGQNVAALKMTDAAYTSARVNGGDITLYGNNGVTLAGTAVLRSVTYGYAAGDTRQAKAGSVTLGIGASDATLALNAGAQIDVAAKRPGDRLVAETIIDPATTTQTKAYILANGDLGGTVTLRAPVVNNDSNVNITLGATVTGARAQEIHAFKSWDLVAIGNGTQFSGVTVDSNGVVHLDAAAVINGTPNLLSDAAPGTVPWFVQNFNVSATSGTSLSGWIVRPEVNLTAAGNVSVDSNINLGAGTVDVAKAVADGNMVQSTLTDANGNNYYQVVAGREAALFANDVTMVYRTGGSVTGLAPVFAITASGNLNVNNSISDGFFNFHDRTNADYLSYQLGGGNRTYAPGVIINCGQGSGCGSGIDNYAQDVANGVTPTSSSTVVIDLTAPSQGNQSSAIFVNSPYTASANSVAANGTGDAFGGAELFPLVNGKPVDSSSLRLVAGGILGSVDPTALNRSSTGSVVIAGEKSYQVVATTGTQTVGGALQLGYTDNTNTTTFGSIDTFLSTVLNSTIDPGTSTGYYTQVNWGTGTPLADAVSAAAKQTFAASQLVTDDAGNVIGVNAALGDVTKFLSGSIGTQYADLNGSAVTLSPQQVVSYAQPNVYYQPVVRTGSGSIKIAAAGNIDLIGPNGVTYRDNLGNSVDGSGNLLGPSGTTAQVGGAAIYTAGTRVAALGVSGTASNAGLGNVSFTANAEPTNYIPSPQGLLDLAPVVAGNGGAVSLTAGQNVLALRDIWGESYLNTADQITTNLPGYEAGTSTFDGTRVGAGNQVWRVGTVGQDTEIAVVPGLFRSGLGALGGGDVSVRAGGSVSGLTLALDNAVVTDAVPTGATGIAAAAAAGAKVLATSASGNLKLIAGGDLLGGEIDVAQGAGTISVGGSIGSAGVTLTTGSYDSTVQVPDQRDLLRLRVDDATVAVSVTGAAVIGGIGALGADQFGEGIGATLNAAGMYSPVAGVSLAASGLVNLVDNRAEQRVGFVDLNTNQNSQSVLTGYVLPPSLALASLGSDINLGSGFPTLLYPSQYGQLSLIAAGNLGNFSLAMSDAAPTELPGVFSVTSFRNTGSGLFLNNGLGFSFAAVVGSATSDSLLRTYHNRDVTHANDPNPVEVVAGGSISNVQLNLPKAAVIDAGLDIVDFYFEGQNINASDVTTITAGRDLTADTLLPSLNSAANVIGKPYVSATDITLGGPGSLIVSAGRNLGPFLNSVTVGGQSYAGGIQTIGNQDNPWLGDTGANILAMFGVSKGVNYDGLASYYLDPANNAQLDGAEFVQITDSAGNSHGDRTKPIYAPILALWLRSNAPDAFAAVFGSAVTSSTTDAAVKTLSYGYASQLYTAFTTMVPARQQRVFLIEDVYFNELASTANPNGPSYQHYYRGYLAADKLFPSAWGYTNNLATYTTDAATITSDHPYGVPQKITVNGEPKVATLVSTGSADLRLATIETVYGGNISILGPGGNFIAGSVVRTSTQAAVKSTPYSQQGITNIIDGAATNIQPAPIDAIPIGYEGVLSLRGGQVQTFTDGNFLLNQSRLFTIDGGDITMWSSNGNLNAGQGPKTSSNFPPITVRFDPNGSDQVDSAGSVAGAGIAALQPSPSVPAASVTLIAPVGTVDAGDAGVRASGDVFVAAAQVANADNFKVGGTAVGVPTTAVVAAPATPASASSAVAATASQAGSDQRAAANDRQSVIRVDVLGFVGGLGDACADGSQPDANGQCH